MGIQARRIGSARGLFGAGPPSSFHSSSSRAALPPFSLPPPWCGVDDERFRALHFSRHVALPPFSFRPFQALGLARVVRALSTGYFFFDVALSSVCLHPERCRS